MNYPNNKNIWISCGVLSITACLCLGLIATGTAGTLTWSALQPAPTATPAHLVVTPQPSPTPVPGNPTPTPLAEPSSKSLLPEVASQMDEIEQQVAEIRGLKPLYTVPRYLLTRDELRQIVENDFLKDYTPEIARLDELTMKAWGVIPENFDLHAFLTELYTEQIAGYYDQDKKAMFVIQDSQFQGTERQTYAHEYAHALQDMYYGLDTYLNYNDAYCENHSDACTAVQALIEGDATWVATEWMVRFSTDQDYQDLLDFSSTYESPVYDSAPLYLQDSFLFPYRQGLEYIETLIDEKGLPGVDLAFANPPQTTEQIIHPQDDPNGSVQSVQMPEQDGALKAGWLLADDDTLGEESIDLILTTGVDENTRLPEDEATLAATGWIGDRYQVYLQESGDGAVVLMSIIWETEKDAGEFLKAIDDYGNSRWGEASQKGDALIAWQIGEQASQISLEGKQTTWIIAPDQSSLQLFSLEMQ